MRQKDIKFLTWIIIGIVLLGIAVSSNSDYASTLCGLLGAGALLAAFTPLNDKS